MTLRVKYVTLVTGNHVENNRPKMIQSKLIRIDAFGKSTEVLLGEILVVFNGDNRATFLCERGRGVARIQQLRMRLSRLRAKMDSKGIPKQHFRLEARLYPYTNAAGKRMDCIVMEKIVSQIHSIAESLEGILKNADTTGNGSNGQGAGNGHAQGFDW